MKKRLFSIVLTLCMVLALMPQMVFAEDISGVHDENVTVNSGDTISGGTFNGQVKTKGLLTVASSMELYILYKGQSLMGYSMVR